MNGLGEWRANGRAPITCCLFSLRQSLRWSAAGPAFFSVEYPQAEDRFRVGVLPLVRERPCPGQQQGVSYGHAGHAEHRTHDDAPGSARLLSHGTKQRNDSDLRADGRGCSRTFLQAGAPVRQRVGTGYVLAGVVRSAKDCAPIPGARIELWLAGPDGRYDDDHRATVITDGKGRYRFESNAPPPYYGRPPHIHLRVSAKGFATLVTQHYPEQGRTDGNFDIVLIPAG